MQLSEKANIAFIYSIVKHPYLGLVIEPFLVEVTNAGNFSLAHQRLIASNAKLYPHLLTDHDVEVVKILEAISPESLVKRFYRKGTIRPKEFFEKKCDESLFKSTIRPFIEKRLLDAFHLINVDKIYFASETKNPTAKKLTVFSEKASVLFHFNRTESETRYFATIKLENERLKLLGNSALLIYEPAHLIVDDKLIVLNDVDGKKLEPFLTKYYISVARRSEEIFFKKFGLELIEKFNVRAEGFEIKQESHNASAIIKLDVSMDEHPWFILSFKYDTQVFPYHSKKNAHVIYDKKGEDIFFRKIRRSRDWEEHKREFIESLGLTHKEGSVFVLKNHGIKREHAKNELKYKAIEWMERNLPGLKGRGFDVQQNFGREVFFMGEKNLKVHIEKNGDWFDVQTKVWFGEFEIPFIQLKKNILNGDREFVLPNCEIALLPEEWMAKFQGLMRYDLGKGDLRIEKMHWGLLGTFATTTGIETKLQGLQSFEEIRPTPLPKNFKGTLRDYQIAGYNWFYFLQEYGFGGCLADDMGLGKTVQTLALLQNEKETTIATNSIHTNTTYEAIKPEIKQLSIFETPAKEIAVQGFAHKRTSLLIVPTSLIYTWINEAKQFTPDLKIAIHTGQARAKTNADFGEFDVVLSTYGTVRNDEDLFINFNFHYIILDESQNIKNPQSMVSKTMRNLHCTHRLVLTGTPVENTIKDLWSQISFVNKGLLGGLKFFEDNYVIPIEKSGDQDRLNELKTLIKPFILRRTKQQVAKELPEKTEQILYCDMSAEQEKLYEEVKSQFRNEILTSIDKDGINKSRLNIIVGLTKLRQIANHPLLVEKDFDGTSGKFLALMERTTTAIESGHKILIYSQFVKQLQIIKTEFDKLGLKYCYFDGSFSSKERQKQVKMFQETDEIPIFLVSLKAGGVGLTLTSADYVFIIDPWWNPSVEKQAVDRTHRIGQTKRVFSYKFITKNSVEEKIINLQNKKLDLASDLVLAEESFYKRLNADDIKNILG